VADYLFAKDRIFATLTLDPAELALYGQVYDLLRPRVVRPDLVVYLQARTDVLLQRVRRRGRDYERAIEPAYLEALAKAYGDFFFHYEETPLLVVNTSDIDVEGDPDDLEALLTIIRRHRKGTQHYVPLGTRPY
jgi:deoxyadenosine/deoxycytidine kinase